MNFGRTTKVLRVAADVTTVAAGVIMLAAKWRWVRNETWGEWRERYYENQAAKR